MNLFDVARSVNQFVVAKSVYMFVVARSVNLLVVARFGQPLHIPVHGGDSYEHGRQYRPQVLRHNATNPA